MCVVISSHLESVIPVERKQSQSNLASLHISHGYALCNLPLQELANRDSASLQQDCMK